MTSCARPAQTADAPKQIKRSEPSSEAEKKREREMERLREREGERPTANEQHMVSGSQYRKQDLYAQMLRAPCCVYFLGSKIIFSRIKA